MDDLKQKVDISNYKYKTMYERFITEKTPSMCVTGTLDVTKIYKLRKKHKFNALLCYAIMQAGQKVDEFHYSIAKDGLYYYKNIKVNAVINGKDGDLYYADYKYFDNFPDFEKEYLKVNKYVSENCVSFSEDTGALLATSAFVQYPFDSVSINLSDTFWDNFLLWGAYKKHHFKVTLSITLRFHHATIDGQRAALFFNTLQNVLDNFSI